MGTKTEMNNGLLNDYRKTQNEFTFIKHELSYLELMMKKNEAEEGLRNDIELYKNYIALERDNESAETMESKTIIMKWCLTGLKKVKAYNKALDEVGKKRTNAAKKLTKKCD